VTFRSDADALRLQLRVLREEIDALERERRDLEREASTLESEVEARVRALSGGAWRAPAIVGGLAASGIALAMVIGAGMGSEAETLYGRVTSVSGSPPVPDGARCTGFLSPHGDSDSDYDLQIELVCDGRAVYGGGTGGYIECDDDESVRPRHCVDRDFTAEGGDPRLELSRDAEAVRMRVEEPSWRLDVELALPRRSVR
jgi:hypothetical protein